MTEAAIPPNSRGDAKARPRTDHELITFAVFLDYRARRMRAPVAEPPTADVLPDAPTPDGVPVK